MIREHTLPAPAGLLPVDVVIDIGAGVRPVNWQPHARHVCVEPYELYARVLRDAGYETVGTDALTFLQHADLHGAAVYMLDVLEHMPRAMGETVLRLLDASDALQIVVFTPHGFTPQENDAWGLGGDFWQRHRSGWFPSDFPGWRTQMDPCQAAFFAVSS